MSKSLQTLRVPYSALVYDKRACRYRGAAGKFIDPRTVRQTIEKDIEQTKVRMESHARRAQSGALSVPEWRDLQAREIKALHLAHLAVAKGGFHALTPADFGRVGQIVKGEYQYLSDKADKAAQNPAYLASERFVSESESYADSGIITFEATRKAEEEAAGFGYAISILDDGARHCTPKGATESCPQQTAKGAALSSEIVSVGKRACFGRCRCTIRRFKTREAAEAARA